MATFRGYGKMALGAPKAARDDVAKSASWCVTEKVHGASFSVHVDRTGRLRCAKRTGFLKEHEDFFGHFAMLSRERERLVSMAEELLGQDAAAESVALFGELFGGRYPHPGVEPDALARVVQTGVWYSPRVELIIFDAVSFRRDTDGNGDFAPYRSVAGLAQKHGLLFARPLLIGPRGECANFNPKFPTGVPSELGLPAIEGNLAEGIVVKPWDVPTTLDDRPIFKVKTKEFSEGEGSAPPLGDPAMRAFLLSLVNANRVAAAASKVGSPDDRVHWQEIVDHVISDIVDEVGEEDPEFQRLRAQLRCEAMDLLAAGLQEAD